MDGTNLTMQAAQLKQARNKTSEELHRLSGDNMGNISHYKELLALASEAKRRRDTANSDVHELFDRRKGLVEQARKIDDELRTVEEQIAKSPTESRYPAGVLRKMMNELEWKLQTEGMIPLKEKALSKEISKIKKELDKADKLEPLYRRAREMRDRKHALSLEFRALDKSIAGLQAEADEAHKKVTALYAKSEAVKSSISQYLDLIGEKSKEAGEIRDKLEGTQEEIDRDAARKRKEQEAIVKVDDSRKQLSINERARLVAADFKAGKKISLEDLQVLQASGIDF
ncbi:MAG: hypothetical protein V1708_00925 [Candidatus Micrarchaeota archaeon]